MARFLRRQVASAGHSKLRPPTVLGPAVVQRPVRLRLAEPRLPQYDTRRLPHSKLRAPIVIGPAVVQRPVKIGTARTPARYYQAQSALRPPTITGAVVTPALALPVRTRVATTPTRYFRSKSVLRPPTVVAPVVLAPPVRSHLAVTPRQAIKTTSRFWPLPVLRLEKQVIARALAYGRLTVGSWLAPPTVVTQRFPANAPAEPPPPVVPLAPPLKTRLARIIPKPRIGRTGPSAPAIVDPATLASPIRSRLDTTANRRQSVQHKLQPPTVVAPFVPDTTPAPPLRTKLTRTPRRAYKAYSRVWPIPVLKLETQVIERALVHSPRKVGSFLAPPTIVIQHFPIPSPEEIPPTPPAAPPPPVTTNLARATRPQRPGKFGPAAPAIVSPAAITAKIRVYYSRVPPTKGRWVRFELRQPTVVGSAYLATPTRLKLVRRPPEAFRRTRSALRAPTIVGAAFVTPPAAGDNQDFASIVSGW